MTSIFKYPHIEKLAGQPASVERIPRIHVTQIAQSIVENISIISRDWTCYKIKLSFMFIRIEFDSHEESINVNQR